MLSKQREEVVNLQRERVQSLNDFKSDVDGVSVPMGTLMEAEESVRGFHLTLMDYPPKQYTKGDSIFDCWGNFRCKYGWSCCYRSNSERMSWC